jgi:hypothetical protein
MVDKPTIVTEAITHLLTGMKLQVTTTEQQMPCFALLRARFGHSHLPKASIEPPGVF